MTAPFETIPVDAHPFYVSDGYSWAVTEVGLGPWTDEYWPGAWNDAIHLGGMAPYSGNGALVRTAILGLEIGFDVVSAANPAGAGILDAYIGLYQLATDLTATPKSRASYSDPYGRLGPAIIGNATSSMTKGTKMNFRWPMEAPLIVWSQMDDYPRFGMGMSFTMNHSLGTARFHLNYRVHGAHWKVSG